MEEERNFEARRHY